MKYFFFCCAIMFVSCESRTTKIKKTEIITDAEIMVVEEEPVRQIRTTIQSTPAAEYSEPIKDEMNNGWKFSVAVFETKRTFHYTVRVQAQEVRVSDTLNIPDFGTEPKVEVHKGKEPLTAIIGFLDKKNVFQEYREVSFKNEKLRMRTLHTYYVGTTKTKVN